MTTSTRSERLVRSRPLEIRNTSNDRAELRISEASGSGRRLCGYAIVFRNDDGLPAWTEINSLKATSWSASRPWR